MKIKYKQKGLTISNGVHFENFCEVTVSDVVGKELLKQSNLFEVIGNVETKETKEVPKAKTTRNTKTVKPKEQVKEQSKETDNK